MYILYQRHEDAIILLLCMSIPITITIAGHWLNSVIFHDDIKCNAANGQMIIYVSVIYTKIIEFKKGSRDQSLQ